jgi:membrane dipeptidase
MTKTPAIFDGHNDFLLRLLRHPAARDRIWLEGDGNGHLDLPRMQQGGFAGGFFAIYIPSPAGADLDADMERPQYDLALPSPVPLTDAQPVALAMAGHLLWMERASNGQLRICRTVQEIRDCMASGVIAAIMHMEGAEAIGPDLDALDSFYAMGLRSLGIVWSRPTAFGHGVPFRFPGKPDTGPGLTDAGKELVRRCNELRILIDLSHLNEKGFDDVARLSNAPLVATHSNAHAITPSTRNLTDRQLAVIRDSGGMVGVNFATSFLRPDGRKADPGNLDVMLQHMDHLIEHLGEDHVGLGSDFDGASIPETIGDVAGLGNLRDAMRAHGYDKALMRKLCHENWLTVLDATW